MKKVYAVVIAASMLIATLTVMGTLDVTGNQDTVVIQDVKPFWKKVTDPPRGAQTYVVTDQTGKGIAFGTLRIWNDRNYLYIQANTNDPWTIHAFRAMASNTLTGIIMPEYEVNGDMMPGSVPWTHFLLVPWYDTNNVNTHTFKEPLTSIKGTQLYIGAWIAATIVTDSDAWVWAYPGDYDFPEAELFHTPPPHYVVYTVR